MSVEGTSRPSSPTDVAIKHLEVPFPEPGECGDLFLLRESFFCIFCRLAHEPFARDPVIGKIVHEELHGIPVGGKDDDPAVRAVFELLPDKRKDNCGFGVQFRCPAKCLVKEPAKDRILANRWLALLPPALIPSATSFAT